MRKKLVSLLLISALVATSVFMMNSSSLALTSYEYKSNSVSQVNHASTQSSDQLNSVSKLSAVSQERTVSYPNLQSTFTSNQSEYQPGQAVTITGDTSNAGLNGSLTWSLVTPMNEQVFSTNKSAGSIFFSDPLLQVNTSVNDWVAQGSAPAPVVNNGLLNLTATSGPAKFSYANAYKDIKGTFDFQFKYFRNSTLDNNNMTVSYFNGTNFQSFNLNATTSNSVVSVTQTLTLDTTNSSVLYPLNITLLGTTDFVFYPISVNYDLPSVDLTDGNPVHSGTLENVWVHGSSNKQRDIIDMNYYINNSVSFSNSTLSFNFTLPTSQLYMGEWQFNLIVTPVDSNNNKLVDHVFIVPLLVKYNVYFDLQRQFIYRGVNETDSTSIYKDETNSTTVYSPSDKIVFVGQLFTNVTGRENLDSNYFNTLNGSLVSQTFVKGTQSYNWTDNQFTSFSDPNEFQTTGFNTTLLPGTLQNNYTWIIGTTIPNRGIYSQVNETLNLNFKSDITTTVNNETFSADYLDQVNLRPINVKFDLNVTSYEIPFTRTYFITEFFEGNFTVNTYHYNLTALQPLNSAVNQSYSWQLNIPKSDLLFSVYLQNNATGVLEQNLTTSLLNDGQTFYFSGTLSSNLNTQDVYHLGINWLNPKYSNEKSVHEIEFKPQSKIYYSIKGTLTLQVPLTIIQFRQGDNLILNFNVTIDQLNNRPALGLNLTAQMSNSTTLHPMIIENGVNFIMIMNLPDNVPIGYYTINIYKQSTNTFLGSIQIKIIPHEVNQYDESTTVPIYYSIFGAVLAIIVLLGFFVQIMRFRKGSN